jgi:tRNA pseudouridine13 synthase
LQRVRQLGFPNFYGSQRFGKEGETVRFGLALLKESEPPLARDGRKPNFRNPFLKKLALSAVQAALFNTYLAGRIIDGLLRTVLLGDVMCKLPVGGMFLVEDVAKEQARFDNREIVQAGPIYGKKTFAAAGKAAGREGSVLQTAGLTLASFKGFGKMAQGTRRHNLVYVDDLHASFEPEGVRITFTLPAGSYATVLLQEIMKNTKPGDDEES